MRNIPKLGHIFLVCWFKNTLNQLALTPQILLGELLEDLHGALFLDHDTFLQLRIVGVWYKPILLKLIQNMQYFRYFLHIFKLMWGILGGLTTRAFLYNGETLWSVVSVFWWGLDLSLDVFLFLGVCVHWADEKCYIKM